MNMMRRAAVQKLLNGEWKSADALLPTQEPTLQKMVALGWLDRREQSGVAYRITEAGLAAFRAPL